MFDIFTAWMPNKNHQVPNYYELPPKADFCQKSVKVKLSRLRIPSHNAHYSP